MRRLQEARRPHSCSPFALGSLLKPTGGLPAVSVRRPSTQRPGIMVAALQQLQTALQAAGALGWFGVASRGWSAWCHPCLRRRPLRPRNPCVTLQRSSNTLASRRPWIAGSRRLSSRTLCSRRGQLQPRQPRQRPGGGGQAGEPRRAGLPAGGAPAVAARPWQPPAVPKFHQRPRGLGVDQQWGAAGPPRAGHS